MLVTHLTVLFAVLVRLLDIRVMRVRTIVREIIAIIPSTTIPTRYIKASLNPHYTVENYTMPDMYVVAATRVVEGLTQRLIIPITTSTTERTPVRRLDRQGRAYGGVEYWTHSQCVSHISSSAEDFMHVPGDAQVSMHSQVLVKHACWVGGIAPDAHLVAMPKPHGPKREHKCTDCGLYASACMCFSEDLGYIDLDGWDL